LVLILDS